MGCLDDRYWVQPETQRDYRFYFDANKKTPGIQIDFKKYNAPFNGISVWKDAYDCDGPEVVLLWMTPALRQSTYKDIRSSGGASRISVFGKLIDQIDRLRNAGWFHRGSESYDAIGDQWCRKVDHNQCITKTDYQNLRNREDVLITSAQIVVGELRAFAKK